MDRRLDMLLVQIMGACFIAVVAAHITAGVRAMSCRKPVVLHAISMCQRKGLRSSIMKRHGELCTAT